MTRPIRLTLLTAAALAAPASTATYALFTNGGFEAGDFSGGWAKSTFLNSGLSGAQPFSGVEHRPQRRAARDRTTVGGPAATPLSLSDPDRRRRCSIRASAQYAARVELLAERRRRPQPGRQLAAPAVDRRRRRHRRRRTARCTSRFAYLPILEDGGAPAEPAALLLHRRPQPHEGHGGLGALHVRQRGGRALVSPSGAFRYTGWQARRRLGRPGRHRRRRHPGARSRSRRRARSAATAATSTSMPSGRQHPRRIGRRHGAVEHGAERALTYDMHVANGGTSPLASPVVSIDHPGADDVRLGDQPGLLACERRRHLQPSPTSPPAPPSTSPGRDRRRQPPPARSRWATTASRAPAIRRCSARRARTVVELAGRGPRQLHHDPEDTPLDRRGARRPGQRHRSERRRADGASW